MDKNLLLVGSIPYDTVEEVFETFGTRLGPHLNAMPDGEVGPRSHWISRVHFWVLALHPDIEVIQQPALENGVERMVPRGTHDSWRFKVRDGVDQIRFGDPGWRLGFARDAINSYYVFRTLRSAGKFPADLRFQVSMPSVNSAIPPRIFDDLGDRAKVMAGYEAALAAELETIVDRIPAKDLAIQWDCSTDLQDVYGAVRQLPNETRIARNVEHMRRLNPLIPEGAQLGYHLCFGTLGGWPRFEPADLAGAVDLANAFAAESGRRVDWLHIPVLDRSDDAFFEPLARLRPEGARVYLGMIHNMERYGERVAAARKFLPDFGVGAYCGFGRKPKSELDQILNDHIAAAGG
ncbi:MAG: hypothetical protein AB7O43_19975 [Hyphomicrobiaceae bacterium]